jgi:DNA polymerase III subunit epsilon
MFDHNTPLDGLPLAFLDVETTGLSPEMGDRVCEVAILRCEGGEIVDALQQLVNPQRPMGAGAYAVHGISDEALADAPYFPQVAPDVLALLDGAVWVGHNVLFDLGFLASELARQGAGLPPYIALDTMHLARACFRLRSYALGRAAEALGIRVEGQHHRAMVDVLQTRALLEHICAALRPRGVHTMGGLLATQGGELRVSAPRPLDIPPLLREAMVGNRMLRLRYLAEDGVETDRLVRPLAVNDRSGSLILLAHCYLRDALRTFRLDRIAAMELVTD